MADAFLLIGVIVSIGVIGFTAIALLAAREARQHRLLEERRPVADRICDIGKDAAFMVRELQRVFDQHQHESLKGVSWIPSVVEFYRRLEALALSSTASSIVDPENWTTS